MKSQNLGKKEKVYYKKSSLLKAKKYKECRDLVESLLQEEKKYEIYEVDQIIKDYLKGKVE